MAFQEMVEVSVTADNMVNNELTNRELGSGADLRNETQSLVVDGWTSAQGYAADSFTTAESALNALGNAAALLDNIPTVDANLADVNIALQDLSNLLASAPSAPSVDVNGALNDYTSEELTLLQTYIDQWIAGDYTGLQPAVEQAIWERGRAREATASNKKAQEAYRMFASRGFSKRPGALAVELLDAAQEAQDNAVTLSRDIMIKQADLEQSNRRFAFETATKIQTALMQYMTDKWRRSLEASKAVADATVSIFGHEVSAFNAEAGFQGSYVGAQATMGRVEADIQIAEANLRIAAAKANIQALIQKASIIAESIRGSAQISGQLASAALSAVNLSGGISSSVGWSEAVSDARSRSISASVGAQSSRQENYTP